MEFIGLAIWNVHLKKPFSTALASTRGRKSGEICADAESDKKKKNMAAHFWLSCRTLHRKEHTFAALYFEEIVIRYLALRLVWLSPVVPCFAQFRAC